MGHYVAKREWKLIGSQQDALQALGPVHRGNSFWLRGLDLNQRPLGYEQAVQPLSAVESIVCVSFSGCQMGFWQSKVN